MPEPVVQRHDVAAAYLGRYVVGDVLRTPNPTSAAVERPHHDIQLEFGRRSQPEAGQLSARWPEQSHGLLHELLQSVLRLPKLGQCSRPVECRQIGVGVRVVADLMTGGDYLCQ